MIKKIIFLFLFFASFDAFSSCVFKGCYTISANCSVSSYSFCDGHTVCTGSSRQDYYSCTTPVPKTCPSGYTRDFSSGACNPPPTPPPPPPPQCKSAETINVSTNSCVPPTCTAPQFNDAITGACISPPVPPDCVPPATPMSSNCAYPNNKGTGQNCTDGSTVYAPMVCLFAGKWSPQIPPGPGQSATCSNGSVIGYPNTCIAKYISTAKANFGIGQALAIVLGTLGPGSGGPKPVLRVAGTLVDGLPSIRSVLPMEAKINNAGLSAYASIDTSIPKITFGKALTEYIKSSTPSSTAYTNALISEAALGAAKTVLKLNTNTGELTSIDSTVPWSSNQVADLALRTNTINPIPFSDIAPYIDYGTVPWLEPAVDAIEGDFVRVYDQEGQQEPLNFPNITPGVLTPVYDQNTPSIVTIDENSSNTYLKPQTETTTQVDPSTNTNPTGTDATISPTVTPTPGTSIDPAVQDTVPGAPTLYSDTWKYFDFLPMANPFLFDVSAFLPKLPSTSCYYEIHRVIHVPFMGPKNFDVAPCVPLQPLRAVLQWAFAVLTAWACFIVIFRGSV